ncbi:MAG: DUF5711 family protein [Defluviitaleaceae bacterium]|nr:DUF5711 family protein [Defluviitaleaceae bacterium]
MDNRKAKSINKKRFFIISAIALIFIGLIVFEVFPNIFSRRDREYFFNTTNIITLSEGNAIEKHIASGGFFILDTSDGISFYNTAGQRVFRHGHGIRGATLFGDGDFAAVVAFGGRVINVYNSTGLVYSTMSSFPVHRFVVGDGGRAIAILDIGQDAGYEVVLFDQGGRAHHLLHLRDSNIMPVALALSSGNLLAIGQVDINNARINSTITFVNFSFQNGVYIGEVVASSLDNQGELVGYMHFVDDSSLVVVSDRGIFSLDITAATIFEAPFHNRIFGMNFSQGGLFAIAYGDGLLSQEAPPAARGSVGVYNATGQAVASFENNIAPTDIYIGDRHIILHMGGFYVVSFDGEVVRPLPLLGNVISVGFLGSDDRVIALTATGARVLELMPLN